ncbi:MAG: hypothetical protein IKF82_06890 [Bacilli bacterium]|nr:hypothetical protein [Bacilli bacterium]
MEKQRELKVIILENDSARMKVIENVKIIRINDRGYKLLIMKDYWPVVGEIDGSIIIDGDEEYPIENIKGFYSLSHNIFHLIIR